VTDYVKITEEAGGVVCVCIWYCGPDINDTLHRSQGGVRLKNIRCTAGFYRCVGSDTIDFRFRFRLSAESGISAFGRVHG